MIRSKAGRRGSYATLFGITSVAFVGFGAIAVDISMLRLADAEMQAVADAAAQAAVLELRRSDDRGVADQIGKQVISANRVAGLVPTPDSLQFGVFEAGAFTPNGLQANSVRVDVGASRRLPFAGFWGVGNQNVRGTATAAIRSLHTILVVDITNSWDLADFFNARDGVLAVFDTLTAAASNADRIGCVVFYGKYGHEFTELMLVRDALTSGVRDQWAAMSTASVGCPGGAKCSEDRMPIQLGDETGTDHAIGIQMATKMFAEIPDPTVYRAMIVVTDGQPAGIGAHLQRGNLGLVETRWRYEYTGEVARNPNEIKAASETYAETAYNLLDVNTWMVSYKQSGEWMEQVSQGDGYFIRTDNSTEMEAIFGDIAESLPITLVE